jgi:FMN phosphatase YigB (HAD superfamily)
MILTDVDGVLLNWIHGFKEFVELKGFTVDTDEPYHYDLRTWLKTDNVLPLIEEFNYSSYFKQLKPIAGAVDAMSRLSKKYQIVVISSCGVGLEEARTENLVNVFGDIFKDIICIPLAVSKERYLARYKNCWWIEDNYEHAKSGADLGHTTLLFKKYTNQTHRDNHIGRTPIEDNLVFIDHWEHAETLINFNDGINNK